MSPEVSQGCLGSSLPRSVLVLPSPSAAWTAEVRPPGNGPNVGTAAGSAGGQRIPEDFVEERATPALAQTGFQMKDSHTFSSTRLLISNAPDLNSLERRALGPMLEVHGAERVAPGCPAQATQSQRDDGCTRCRACAV